MSEKEEREGPREIEIKKQTDREEIRRGGQRKDE